MKNVLIAFALAAAVATSAFALTDPIRVDGCTKDKVAVATAIEFDEDEGDVPAADLAKIVKDFQDVAASLTAEELESNQGFYALKAAFTADKTLHYIESVLRPAEVGECK